MNQLPKSVVRYSRTPRSVGTGGGRPPPVNGWVGKRSVGKLPQSTEPILEFTRLTRRPDVHSGKPPNAKVSTAMMASSKTMALRYQTENWSSVMRTPKAKKRKAKLSICAGLIRQTTHRTAKDPERWPQLLRRLRRMESHRRPCESGRSKRVGGTSSGERCPARRLSLGGLYGGSAREQINDR